MKAATSSLYRRRPFSSLSHFSTKNKKSNHPILRVHGPDRTGIVASVSRVLDRHGCGIIQSEQWTDTIEHLFFQRIVFSPSAEEELSSEKRRSMEQEIQQTCDSFSLRFCMNWRERRKRVAIFVSKYDHCLWELLLRNKEQDLDCDVVAVLSNHDDLSSIVLPFGIPFYTFTETKLEREQKQLALLEALDVDLVILARYMQVLSQHFLERFPSNRIINIHHSFLPAFKGGSPYQQAYLRGCKLIGATAHYVTVDLDGGPILEQDVKPVSHRDTPHAMRQKGRLIERNVLVRAVRAHLDDRVISYQNKCVVFVD